MENNIIEQEITQEEKQENTQEMSQEVAQETNNVADKEKKSNVCDESTKPVSYSAFFWLMWLFKIPVIGWIACAIFMFVPKRKSLNNYARAFMTWLILKLTVLFLIISLVANIVGSLVLPDINNSLGTQFNDIGEIVEVATDVITGNYTDVIDKMKPVLIDNLGEEFEPVVNEFTKPEYNDLINQIINGDYAQALYDFEAGKYIALKDVLGAEIYDGLTSELKAAANGEPSVFDELREIIPSLDLQSLMNGEAARDFYESENVIVQKPQNSVEVAVIS